MFTLLQSHPCYLVNWLCAALVNNIDLYDDHPLAYLDEEFMEQNKDVKEINKN